MLLVESFNSLSLVSRRQQQLGFVGFYLQPRAMLFWRQQELELPPSFIVLTKHCGKVASSTSQRLGSPGGRQKRKDDIRPKTSRWLLANSFAFATFTLHFLFSSCSGSNGMWPRQNLMTLIQGPRYLHIFGGGFSFMWGQEGRTCIQQWSRAPSTSPNSVVLKLLSTGYPYAFESFFSVWCS